MRGNTKDILIEEGPDLVSAIQSTARILTELGLKGQTMPQIREEITIRVFGLDGQEPQLVKRLKQKVAGFKKLVAS